MTRTAPLTLLLAACNREADAPDPALTESVPPEALGYGPDVEALPVGEAISVGDYAPGDGYRWAEDACQLNYAFEDDRPDFVYAYGDVEPWGWRSSNGWYRNDGRKADRAAERDDRGKGKGHGKGRDDDKGDDRGRGRGRDDGPGDDRGRH